MTLTLSNQMNRARKIMQALQQGVHPNTGEELPADSIANDIEVNRAIGTSILAIDQMVARAQRRAQLPGNVGRSWSKEEEATLVSAFKAGEATTDIATRHGRTLRAIEARLERLNLLQPDQRVTNNSFVTPPGKDNK